MSSKTAKQTPGHSAALRAPWPCSITGRLTVLYTVSAFGTLVLSAMFLYWVLVNNLERADHQFLSDKIHVLRVMLQERPDNLEVLEEEVKWEGATRQFTKYYARILDERYRTLIETPGMDAIIPPLVISGSHRAICGDWGGGKTEAT